MLLDRGGEEDLKVWAKDQAFLLCFVPRNPPQSWV
jgi:hypothetical protein